MSRQEIENKLQSCELGLKRKTVSLKPYSNQWPKAYEFIADLLKPLLPDCTITHVGSTAIPGCDAKPIIDVLISHSPDSDFAEQTLKLIRLGFIARGEKGIPGRSCFNFYDQAKELDFVHLHAFAEGHQNAIDIKRYGEILRANPKLVKDYTWIKQELLDMGCNRATYTFAKGDFIAGVIG